MNKRLEHYTKTIQLLSKLNEHLKTISYSWFDEINTEEYRKDSEYLKAMPKLETEDFLKKIRLNLGKKEQAYLKKRDKIAEQLNKLIKKGLNGDEMKRAMFKIYITDEAFNWVGKSEGGYNQGNMFRSFWDCSNGDDLIYKKCIKKCNIN